MKCTNITAMPLTPFIGLSVMVHIFVIISHRFFQWTPAEQGARTRGQQLVTRAIGLTIVSLVFVVVLFSAGTLVRASIEDRHSSIAMAETIYGHFFPAALSPAVAANVTPGNAPAKATTTAAPAKKKTVTVHVPAGKPAPVTKVSNGIDEKDLTPAQVAYIQNSLTSMSRIFVDIQAEISSSSTTP